MTARTMISRVRSTCLALPAAILLSMLAPNSHASLGCEFLLCMANPRGPLALDQCKGPVKKVWRLMAKGKPIPPCTFEDAKGTETDSKASGSYITHTGSDPYTPGGCPFTYYAGEARNKYCAFSGVTNEYVDGVLWGRIWHGGPTDQPYIEYLHVDPDHPREADGFEAAWALLKSSIEDKSDYAARAMEIAVASEARAVASERIAAKAKSDADNAVAALERLEALLPGELIRTQEAWNAASVAWDAVAGPYLAAKAKAEGPGATAADRTAYEALRPAAENAFNTMQNAANAAHYVESQIASLPAKRVATQAVVDSAAAAAAEAAGKRATANADQAERVAAAKAAEPYPDYYGGGGGD